MQVDRWKLFVAFAAMCAAGVVMGEDRHGTDPVVTSVAALCARSEKMDGARVRIHGIVRTDRRHLILLLDAVHAKVGISLVVPPLLRQQASGARLMRAVFTPPSRGHDKIVHGTFIGRFASAPRSAGGRSLTLEKADDLSVEELAREEAGISK